MGAYTILCCHVVRSETENSALHSGPLLLPGTEVASELGRRCSSKLGTSFENWAKCSSELDVPFQNWAHSVLQN
jgi:hypothetical protein